MSSQGLSIDHLTDDQKSALLERLLAERGRAQGSRAASFAQERLWFLDQFRPGLAVYNLPLTLLFPGRVDVGALERALTEIVRRHDVLRTVFVPEDGVPRQVIHAPRRVDLPIVDVQDAPAARREEEAQRLAAEEAQRPFDLRHGPLFRAMLVRLAEDRSHLLLNMHHIVSDGWSTGVLLKELAALYEAYARGHGSPLPELPLQYADYAEKQRRWLSGERLERQLAYWRRQLDGAPTLLALPTDRPRPALQSFAGAWQPFAVGDALCERLRKIGHAAGATPFMVLLAAFKVLLYRYTGQRDLVVGTPIANRNRPEVEGLIGFFVNTLVLRTRVEGSESFEELLRRVRETTLDAYAHQDLPFEKLVEELQPERNLAYNPLFQAMFALQNTPNMPQASGAAEAATPEVYLGTSKFDISISLAETAGRGLSGACEYNTDLFDHATITRLIGHFRTLLESIAAEPQAPLASLPLLTPAERRQILVEWNETGADYPRERCIHELFEAQAARTPDATAVIFEDRSLEYAELNRRANRLARYLRGIGVGPGVRVAVCLERSLDMVVGVLGILKAGGTYVPLDPSYPQARLAFMLEDCRARVLLTHTNVGVVPPEDGDVTIVHMDADPAPFESLDADNGIAAATSDDDVAVFYSSGSTGQPKGSVLRGRGFVNTFCWFGRFCGMSSETRLLLMTPFSFDASFKSMIAPLLFGGTLVLAGAAAYDPDDFLQVLERRKCSITFVTPSLLYALLERARQEGYRALSSLRLLFVGGEPTDLRKLRPWLAGTACRCSLVHIYGPSECSDVTTFYAPSAAELTSRESMPIGAPIANVRHYVVDEHFNPQPVGVPGELCIAGFMLARGYLGRPALTAERFVPNPFEHGERMYRTGDRVRRLPDGNIEFLGRIDSQIKIRGMRVEPEEVAQALEEHSAVHEAVVVACETAGRERELVAYFVACAPVTARALQYHLAAKLPRFMLPSALVELDALPLSPNGKIDRAALPAPPERTASPGDASDAPRTPLEQVIAAIWREVLGLEELGIHDNLFDVGGHSLTATQIVSRLNEALQVDVPIRRIFEAPTIARLSEHLTADPSCAHVEEYAGLLIRVAQLSDEEVASALHSRGGAGSGVET